MVFRTLEQHIQLDARSWKGAEVEKDYIFFFFLIYSAFKYNAEPLM